MFSFVLKLHEGRKAGALQHPNVLRVLTNSSLISQYFFEQESLHSNIIEKGYKKSF